MIAVLMQRQGAGEEKELRLCTSLLELFKIPRHIVLQKPGDGKGEELCIIMRD